MKADINLALGALVESAQKSRLLRILRITALASITLILIASVSLFLLINSISPDKIKKEKDQILFSIKFLNERQAKIAIVNSKIADISKILDNRTNYESEINTFLEKIPNDVSINSFEIDKAKVAITASSDSLSSIDSMLNTFIEMTAKKQIIKSLTIGSLTSDQKSGNYSLSIKANKL